MSALQSSMVAKTGRGRGIGCYHSFVSSRLHLILYSR